MSLASAAGSVNGRGPIPPFVAPGPAGRGRWAVYRLPAGGYSNRVAEDPTIAALSGDVDFTMREEVRRRLNELRTPRRAILDLSDVAYMDSMALSEIILLQRYRENEGRAPLRVVVGPKIARLYEISGIGVLLPAYASVNDALAT